MYTIMNMGGGGFTKCREFTNWLSNSSLAKWDSAQCSWLVAKLDPNVLDCISFLNSFKSIFSLTVKDQVLHPYNVDLTCFINSYLAQSSLFVSPFFFQL